METFHRHRPRPRPLPHSSLRPSPTIAPVPYLRLPRPHRPPAPLCFLAQSSSSSSSCEEKVVVVGSPQHPWPGSFAAQRPSYIEEDEAEALSATNVAYEETIAPHSDEEDDDEDDYDEDGDEDAPPISQHAGGEETMALYTPYTDTKKRRKQRRCMSLIMEGKDPIEILETMPEWNPAELWTLLHYLASQSRFDEALQAFAWWKRQEKYQAREQHYINLIRMFGRSKQPQISQQLFDEMGQPSIGVEPGPVSYAALIHSYAECGSFEKAEDLLKQMRDRGFNLTAGTYNGLIFAYGMHGRYDDMNRVFNNMKRWVCSPDDRTYSGMIVAYAKAGLFRRMERLCQEMDRNGWKPSFATINTIIQAYARHGLLEQMQTTYMRVKDYRLLVNRTTIRAMASVYIERCKFYQLRVLVGDIGLKRNNVGNLLWNLLLLSFGANFQMKNLNRSFHEMKNAGFTHDITTFNIRALSFARMNMLWDLHATLIQMHDVQVLPDLVTFGAVVDAYINMKLRLQSMFKELDLLNMKGRCPSIATDPLVFEAFGKGDFHSSSEMLMKLNPKPYGEDWTYGLLLSFYLRKIGARRIEQIPGKKGVVTKRFIAS